MPREGQLFVGRLSKNTRTRDVEEVFETYGRLSRCELKYGAEMAYAFINFEDKRDAEDAVKYENGREICGQTVIVEWAKGNPRRPLVSGKSYDECYKCYKTGHWVRDCPEDPDRGSSRGKRGSSRDRSRDKSRDRRRSRSRSNDRRRRSRSKSPSSRDQKKKRSPSHSRSKSPADTKNGHKRTRSRSRSRS